MSRITDYNELTTTQPDDFLVIVDSHDLTMSPTGTTKKIRVSNLQGSGLMPLPTGTALSGYVPIATGIGSASVWSPLTAILPLTTLGDIVYENAQPTPARLPGNTTTTKQFLSQTGTGTVSAAPAWGALATTDIPQLSNYAPTGLTGATTATAYAGGTVFGHPLSGTWSAGQWVVDQSGHIYVCIAGGTPGTWRRVSQDPWQFFIEDYAKCDGQQALVTVATGSNIVNSTPLGAPSAPSVSNATSGGTVAAGTYGVKVTYVNRYGETVASANTNTTTTTGASTITITSPTALKNAVSWNAYVTQVNGATYTLQATTPIQQNLTITAPPTSGGVQPPASDTTATPIFTSTGVDGGKNAMINGGLGSPGTPWIGTIVTVNSPTQCVISDTTISVNQANCAMFFASDDRIAVDNCMTDAFNYAVANNKLYQVIAPAKNIGLGANVFQSKLGTSGTWTYNTQLRLLAENPSGQQPKMEGQILGPSDSAHAEFWVAQLPNMPGTNFVSFAIGPSSPDATFGQQSVIGCPSAGQGAGTNGFMNLKMVINGIAVIQPGWSNTIGIDLQSVAGFRMRARVCAYAPSTATGGGINPSSGWPTNTFFQQKIGAAVRFPNEGNNDDCLVDSLTVEGYAICFYSGADHLVINRLATLNTYNIWSFAAVDQNVHDLTINQWSNEACYGSSMTTQGSGGKLRLHIVMDGESTGPVWDINDSGNILYGDFFWGDAFRTAGGPATVQAPVINGAANLHVHNRMLLRQVYGAPTYTLGTALQNPWWDDTQVTLNSGTTTGILIGPTSATCTTSVGTVTTSPVTFKLPSGWWLNIQGSVKPTTYIAIPD